MKIVEATQARQSSADMRDALIGNIAFRWNKAISDSSEFTLKHTPLAVNSLSLPTIKNDMCGQQILSPIFEIR